MAAEILPDRLPVGGDGRRFNEAAANGRGNLEALSNGGAFLVASMRPRRMAAEISATSEREPASPPCFNEAAANGRGNQLFQVGNVLLRCSFNEAAANGRGNQTRRMNSSLIRGWLQ